MDTKEQEEIALKAYERLGSVHAVIRRLGYPSKSTLSHWYERRNADLENRHGHPAEIPEKSDHKCSRPDHPWHPSAEFKYEVLSRCFELGENVEYVSREIGYSRISIYTWRRKCLKYGMVGFMEKKKVFQENRCLGMLQGHNLRRCWHFKNRFGIYSLKWMY